jgi:branched-chain amino acid transport system substrate-binding protein
MPEETNSQQNTGPHCKSVSRREFLKLTGLAGAVIGLGGGFGGLLAACGSDGDGATTTTVASDDPGTTVSTGAEGTGGAQVLRIGSPVALSGFYSVADAIDAIGVKAVAEWFNEKGGLDIGGTKYTIEVVEEDIRSDYDGVSAAMNKLIFDEKVKFIAGPSAFFNPVAAPLATQNQVVHCAGFCINLSGEFDENTPFSFLGGNSWIGRMQGVAKFMMTTYPDVKRVCIASVDDGGIATFTPIAHEYLGNLGLEIVDWIGFANELQDFSPISSRMVATGADAYMQLTGAITHSGNIFKGIRELGDTKPCMMGNTANLPDLLTMIGDPKTTDMASVCIFPGSTSNPPQAEEIIGKIQAKLGTDTALYLDNTQAMYSLVRAIEAAQSVDPVEVRDFWSTMTEIDSLYGPATMGGKETYGINQAVAHPQPIQFLKDGEVVDGGYYEVNIP